MLPQQGLQLRFMRPRNLLAFPKHASVSNAAARSTFSLLKLHITQWQLLSACTEILHALHNADNGTRILMLS